MSTLPLLLVLVATPLVLRAGYARPAAAPLGAMTTAAAALLLAIYLWLIETPPFSIPWVPSLDWYLSFRYDRLAACYSIVAAGIGLLVLIYSTVYIPHHLQQQSRDSSDQAPFYALLLLFLAAMLGLASADDFILLFLFFELTTVCSYFLIAFDRQREQARAAALNALLVTGVSSLGLLLGLLILYDDYGSFSIHYLQQHAEAGNRLDLALALISVAALAKSAQLPLHFWLPQAMAAPTPVSAYLHSAAMVAAGVFVLHRLHPLLELSPAVRMGILSVALVSIAIGGLLALVVDDLKHLLAYSTIAQYGYVSLLLALGGALGAAAAAYYVLAHAICKSALFMVAGTVDTVAGTRRLSELGGLGRQMPVLAVVSAIAAATLAGLPLTMGFFKDELLFKAGLEYGHGIPLAAVAAAMMTILYSWRFWSGLFLGRPRIRAEKPDWRMLFPILLLAVLAMLGGISTAPVQWAAALGAELHAVELELHAAYQLAATPENAMALSAYGLAAFLWFGRSRWYPAVTYLQKLSERYGPARILQITLSWLNRISRRLHVLEVKDLRDRLAGILLPAGMLMILSLLFRPDGMRLMELDFGDARPALIVILLMLAGIAVLTTVQTRHLGLLLSMTGIGFALAIIFALLGAPDVALVAVLVETALSLLFIATLALLPGSVLRREVRITQRASTPWFRLFAGAVAASLVFIVVWTTLAEPGAELTAEGYRQISLLAHADNIVAAILVDFRGLDTLGEATVLIIALLAVIGLLRDLRRERV